MIINDATYTREIQYRIAMAIEIKFKEETRKCYVWKIADMELKLGHFVEKVRNTWKFLRCDAGEEWIRTGPIV
jgi:hypothetical protein